MAVSEHEIEPDLNKAPPHVEGELLKRNTKAVISKWQKRFFVVHRDKLQYYSKKEDYKSGREPLNVVRLLRVKDITESVFNNVPKKHHINSGFTVVELLPGGEEVIYHLLAETPDLMRYWVHALRYVKSYWSKLEVRETVLNEEQEKKLLERLLREEEIEDDMVFVGEYSVDDNVRSGSADWDTKQLCIPIHFPDGSKVSVYTDVGESAGTIIEKVRDRLTSSASQIWVVNNEGEAFPLNYSESVILFHPSSHQFFLVDPTNRVLVVFIANIGKDYVATIVPHKITSHEVIEHPDVATKLDIAGIANRGLFLQKDNEALLFDSSECPCEVLFSESVGGRIERRDLGCLVVKNKTLEQKWSSKKLRQTIRKHTRPPSKANSDIPIIEEESDQRRALDKIQQLRDGKIKREPLRVNESPRGSPRVRSRSKAFVLTGQDEQGLHELRATEISSSPIPSPDPSPNPSPLPSPVPSPRRIVTSRSPPIKRQAITVKKQIRRTEEVYMKESRSSGFGLKSELENSGGKEEERLDHLFSANYQEDTTPVIVSDSSPQSSISSSITNKDTTEKTEEDNEPISSLKPFVLSVDSLSQYSMMTDSNDDNHTPVIIHKPSILKVILLQTQHSTSTTTSSDTTIKLISMSGVILHYKNGKWDLHGDSTYHQLPSQELLTTGEVYTLAGGIRAVYDSNGMCWYVLPSLLQSPISNSPVLNDTSIQESIDSALAQVNITASDSFYNMKRSIATNIGTSFMTILNQFNGSLSTDEKKKIASDMTNERLGHMFRGSFCSSIASLLLDGVKLQKLGGLIQYDVWKLINIFCQEGLNMSSPSNVSLSIDTQVMRPIKGEGRLISGDMKFRSFVCLAISRGLFLQWLTELPLMEDTLKKHYSKNSLLYLVHSGDQLYTKLYEEILLSLQPMSFFPFQLSIDFEIKFTEKQETQAPHNDHTMEQGRVNDNGQVTSIINENHEKQITPPTPSPSSGLLTNTLLGNKKPQWFKSLTYNLTNLNMGGVLTGPPPPSTTTTTSTSTSNNIITTSKSSERHSSPSTVPIVKEEQKPVNEQSPWNVVALYDCSGDDEDELSFEKGDILQAIKEINNDWLLCHKGDKKGIVPLSFVQKCN